MGALLRLLLARQAAQAEAPTQAQAQLEQWRESQPREGQEPCLLPSELEQLLVLRHEAEAAQELGFVPLMERVWEVMAAAGRSCAGQRQQPRGGSGDQNEGWLSWLGGGGGAARGEVCIPSAPGDGTIMRWLQAGSPRDLNSLCDHVVQ